MTARVKVVLDTDIGSDIDDAVALAYLLAHPRCDLLGVTTVTGNVQQRAACAAAVCRAFDRRDIPIRTGHSATLGPGPGQPAVPQYPAIADAVPAAGYEGGAVDFLRETIREQPGEVILLSIGPFTNVAALFAADPGIGECLGGFVSMGGRFHGEPWSREWNARVDPWATAVAYRKAPAGHISIGLDVTLKCEVEAAVVREAFATPALAPVLAMAEVWFGHRPVIRLHDPLAAAVVFEPSLCDYEAGSVRVVLDGDAAGATVIDNSRTDGRHRVAVAVRADEAVAEIMGTITGEEQP